jgi:hypothetical protein
MNFATEVFAFWACLTFGLAFVTQRARQVLANVQRPSGTCCLVATTLGEILGDLRSLAIEGGLLHGCESYVR